MDGYCLEVIPLELLKCSRVLIINGQQDLGFKQLEFTVNVPFRFVETHIYNDIKKENLLFIFRLMRILQLLLVAVSIQLKFLYTIGQTQGNVAIFFGNILVPNKR